MCCVFCVSYGRADRVCLAQAIVRPNGQRVYGVYEITTDTTLIDEICFLEKDSTQLPGQKRQNDKRVRDRCSENHWKVRSLSPSNEPAVLASKIRWFGTICRTVPRCRVL